MIYIYSLVYVIIIIIGIFMYDCYRNSHYRITMGVIDSYGAAYGCYKAAQNTTGYELATLE